MDPELRKSFEVALHAGTACALLVSLRSHVHDFLRRIGIRDATVIGLSFLPAAAAGYRWERVIEDRLGKPQTVALALAVGSIAMAAADRLPEQRDRFQAGPVDGLWLGVAQAMALVPGVSRNGATLAMARWRRFTRPDANELSRRIALPVIVGASVLKGVRLARRGIDPSARRSLAAGFGSAFVSTMTSVRLIGMLERSRSLAPYAAYRLGLAAATLAILRRRSGQYG